MQPYFNRQMGVNTALRDANEMMAQPSCVNVTNLLRRQTKSECKSSRSDEKWVRASGTAVDVFSELNGPAGCGVNRVVFELEGCCLLQQTSSEFLGV